MCLVSTVLEFLVSIFKIINVEWLWNCWDTKFYIFIRIGTEYLGSIRYFSTRIIVEPSLKKLARIDGPDVNRPRDHADRLTASVRRVSQSPWLTRSWGCWAFDHPPPSRPQPESVR